MKESVYLEKIDKDKAKEYKNAVSILERGNKKEAEKKIQVFVKKNPEFVPAYNKLAIIAIYQKDYQLARDFLQKALDIDSEFAPGITNLGSIYKEEGNNQKAKEYYQQAIHIDDEYGPAYNNLGVIYREEGNYGESVKYLKKAGKLKSLSFESKDRPFYRDPGCLSFIFIIILIVILLLYILK